MMETVMEHAHHLKKAYLFVSFQRSRLYAATTNYTVSQIEITFRVNFLKFWVSCLFYSLQCLFTIHLAICIVAYMRSNAAGKYREQSES